MLKKLNKKSTHRKAGIFCLIAISFMVVQWVIFYLLMHLNSIVLAFKYFDPTKGVNGDMVYLPFNSLLTNFKAFVGDLFNEPNITRYFFNGALFHLVALVAMPLSLMVAYVIVKKLPATGFFKVILFLPHVISSMILALMFRYVSLNAFRGIWTNIFHKPYNDFPALLVTDKYAFGTLLVYQFFFAIPGSLLINLGTMSRVPTEIIESGKLEGISYFREFINIYIPLMFPVLQVYLLGMFVGFFTAQGPLYAIYGSGASTKIYLPDNAKSLGYYMFVSATADTGGADKRYMYGYTAAANLLIGVVSVPIVYITKLILDKFDPGAEF